MPAIETICAFFAAALLLGVAPGPDNIFVLTQSALSGARAGIATTLGLSTGICIQTAAVAFGVSALFSASPLAFNLLKAAGAAYLCWLAWLAFRAGAANPASGTASGFPGLAAMYRRGVIMNVSNPKVCIFFLAFLPQFCQPGRGPIWLQIIIFGLLFNLATIIVFFSVAAMGGALAAWLRKSPRAMIWANRLAGTIFLALAAALALVERPPL